MSIVSNKLTKEQADKILYKYGYWYYMDSGYHYVDLYIKIYGTNDSWTRCDSSVEKLKSNVDYEIKIEHRNHTEEIEAYNCLMKETGIDEQIVYTRVTSSSDEEEYF